MGSECRVLAIDRPVGEDRQRIGSTEDRDALETLVPQDRKNLGLSSRVDAIASRWAAAAKGAYLKSSIRRNTPYSTYILYGTMQSCRAKCLHSVRLENLPAAGEAVMTLVSINEHRSTFLIQIRP